MSQGFLLDTSVISALSPGREVQLPEGFSQWLQAHDSQLFIPCIAIAELAQGISKLRRSGATERARRLDTWLSQLMDGFGERILSLTPPMARMAGELSDQATSNGCHPGFADVSIAAIAMHQGHILLTRNLQHFEPLGVPCQDPIARVPE
jgi:predicted nucleic acid-binding protein